MKKANKAKEILSKINKEIKTWDSFSYLLTMHELETKYDIHFSEEEMLKIKSYEDLKTLVEHKCR